MMLMMHYSVSLHHSHHQTTFSLLFGPRLGALPGFSATTPTPLNSLRSKSSSLAYRLAFVIRRPRLKQGGARKGIRSCWVSYPPPVPRTTFQGHRVQGNIKVDDVHANIFQGHRVSGHRNTGFKGIVWLMMSTPTIFRDIGLQDTGTQGSREQ